MGVNPTEIGWLPSSFIARQLLNDRRSREREAGLIKQEHISGKIVKAAVDMESDILSK